MQTFGEYQQNTPFIESSSPDHWPKFMNLGQWSLILITRKRGGEEKKTYILIF